MECGLCQIAVLLIVSSLHIQSVCPRKWVEQRVEWIPKVQPTYNSKTRKIGSVGGISFIWFRLVCWLILRWLQDTILFSCSRGKYSSEEKYGPKLAPGKYTMRTRNTETTRPVRKFYAKCIGHVGCYVWKTLILKFSTAGNFRTFIRNSKFWTDILICLSDDHYPNPEYRVATMKSFGFLVPSSRKFEPILQIQPRKLGDGVALIVYYAYGNFTEDISISISTEYGQRCRMQTWNLMQDGQIAVQVWSTARMSFGPHSKTLQFGIMYAYISRGDQMISFYAGRYDQRLLWSDELSHYGKLISNEKCYWRKVANQNEGAFIGGSIAGGLILALILLAVSLIILWKRKCLVLPMSMSKAEPTSIRDMAPTPAPASNIYMDTHNDYSEPYQYVVLPSVQPDGQPDIIHSASDTYDVIQGRSSLTIEENALYDNMNNAGHTEGQTGKVSRESAEIYLVENDGYSGGRQS